jgi:hypothetical protein
VVTKTARLWERKILVCVSCGELADKAKAELDAAHRRAEAQAMMYLEQQIMSGALLAKGSGMDLPGIGDTEEVVGQPNPYHQGLVRAKELGDA